MYVHPQHYFHLAGQLKERFAQSRRARPSSSFRTLYFPDEPAAIKTHFPYYLGRYERRLSPSSAEHSDLLSRLIEEICRRDGASLPTDFAFFPEYGVAQPGDEGIPGGFGNVYREIVPHPAAGEPLLIYPFFALYTPDIRFLEHKEPPLLVQLINLNKRTGEHGVDYFVDQIWRNVISSWAHFVFERGVMLEPHGQNLLVGIDYSGRFKKFIHRDFQSCMVDVNLLRQNGLFSGFKKHHLGLETSAEESFSLVYDHFFGHYMMDPIVDVLSRAYSVDKQEIIGRLREVAREVFGANLSRFPAKTLRHKRDVGRFAGNVVSLEVGGRPRYR
jgi:siderophore synthetase component